MSIEVSSLTAERNMLGLLVVWWGDESTEWLRWLRWLSPDDFSAPTHAMLFRAMVDAETKRVSLRNPLSLIGWLRRREEYWTYNVGTEGMTRITAPDLAEMCGPGAECYWQMERWATVLRRYRMRREAILFGRRLITLGYNCNCDSHDWCCECGSRLVKEAADAATKLSQLAETLGNVGT